MSNAAPLEALFFAALEKETAAERSAYLDSACGSDAQLRRQVEKLLRAHPRVGDFLNKPIVAQLTAAQEAADATQAINTSTAGAGRKGPILAQTEGEGAADDHTIALNFLQPSRRPDALGRLGHYEMLEVLGQGGFGTVFRAFDEQLQRVVAIKVLAERRGTPAAARKRFLREARSAARVRHENVVQIYAVEEQPLPYLVMEYVPGETLQQRLDRGGPLEVTEVVRIGRQIAEGLAAAHATGLIHRDIKPGNILIEVPSPLTPLPQGERGESGRVKITDFGLARAADDASVSQSGMVAGTPLYMAPEQAQGDPLDYRADLFSLGSVLYVMCAGQPPFGAKSMLAVIKRVSEDTPRPLPEIIPDVPPWLCDLIARLHAKKPEDRFASAQEVADLLMQHLARSGSRETSVGLARSGSRETSVGVAGSLTDIPQSRRFRPRRWTAAAVLLLLLGVLGFTEATGVTDLRGTVIRLFSPEGTLVVEIEDPGVSVRIDGSELIITGAGTREIRLRPGKYTVEARKDGKVVRRQLVTITKNDKQIVRVSQEASPPDPKAAKATRAAADAAAWERVVAGLPADAQVKAVGARLKELNPRFDGKVKSAIENGVVTRLAFSTDYVSDIAPVRVLTKLRSLDCSGSDVGRGQLSDLAPLRGLPLTNLRCLYTSVADLSALKKMKLTSLDLRHTSVSDADVKTLAGMKDLQVLSLWGTQVTDKGLKELAGLKNLRQLSLQNTQVTDVGLKELAGLHRLQVLDLYTVPGVTDAGLETLAGLKALKYGDLRGTSVTDAGTRKLASALPLLKIVAPRGRVIEPRGEVKK